MLAEQLGCTVRELLERVDSAELTEWIAFHELRYEEQRRQESAPSGEVRLGGAEDVAGVLDAARLAQGLPPA